MKSLKVFLCGNITSILLMCFAITLCLNTCGCGSVAKFIAKRISDEKLAWMAGRVAVETWKTRQDTLPEPIANAVILVWNAFNKNFDLLVVGGIDTLPLVLKKETGDSVINNMVIDTVWNSLKEYLGEEMLHKFDTEKTKEILTGLRNGIQSGLVETKALPPPPDGLRSLEPK